MRVFLQLSQTLSSPIQRALKTKRKKKITKNKKKKLIQTNGVKKSKPINHIEISVFNWLPQVLFYFSRTSHKRTSDLSLVSGGVQLGQISVPRHFAWISNWIEIRRQMEGWGGLLSRAAGTGVFTVKSSQKVRFCSSSRSGPIFAQSFLVSGVPSCCLEYLSGKRPHLALDVIGERRLNWDPLETASSPKLSGNSMISCTRRVATTTWMADEAMESERERDQCGESQKRQHQRSTRSSELFNYIRLNEEELQWPLRE